MSALLAFCVRLTNNEHFFVTVIPYCGFLYVLLDLFGVPYELSTVHAPLIDSILCHP